VPRKPSAVPREASIQAGIREALGLEPDLVLWRNNTGIATHHDASTGREFRVRYGLCVGSSDLIGILGPAGRLVALEVKRPGEKPTDEQARFLALVRRQGGFATVVCSAEQALEALARARQGANE